VLVHEAILNEDFVKINRLKDQLLDIPQDLRSQHPVSDDDISWIFGLLLTKNILELSIYFHASCKETALR